MLKNKFLSFVLFFIITFSASFIGGLVTISFKEPWYSQLVKSNFNPRKEKNIFINITNNKDVIYDTLFIILFLLYHNFWKFQEQEKRPWWIDNQLAKLATSVGRVDFEKRENKNNKV